MTATTMLTWVDLPETPLLELEPQLAESGDWRPSESRKVLGRFKDGSYQMCYYRIDVDEGSGSWRTACSECWTISESWGLVSWAYLP